MIIGRGSAQYEKALAWIVREGRGGKAIPRDVSKVAGWRVVAGFAAVFDKSPKEVATDAIEFAKAIDGEMDEQP
jgi:hypothetical protein